MVGISVGAYRRGTRPWLAVAGAVATGALLALVVAAPLATGGGAFAPVPAADSAPTVKAPIHGLIDRQGLGRLGQHAYVQGYVVKVPWAALQPTAFGPIAPDNAIDRAIARLRATHASADVGLKLRVVAGVDAPEWAKEIAGAPVAYVNNKAGNVTGGTIGRFWEPAYGRAYDDLQTKLAAKYDNVPEIREVTVDRCSTLYDELFVRQVGAQANRDAMTRAGYTVAADQDCIAAAITTHQVWQHTTSDVDFSPFRGAVTPATDLAYTLDMMSRCRTILGSRCGLENNGLSTSKLAQRNFVTMYRQMARLGGAVTLQTAAKGRIGQWSGALDGGVGYGARSIELPAGYAEWPASRLADVSRALQSNP